MDIVIMVALAVLMIGLCLIHSLTTSQDESIWKDATQPPDPGKEE